MKKILFVVPTGVKFDLNTPLISPLGSTESSVCYLARELSKVHDVSILADTDKSDESIDWVYHYIISDMNNIHLSSAFAYNEWDVIIVVNGAEHGSKIRNVSPNAKLICWEHRLPTAEDPIPEYLYEPFHLVVYVSEYQKSEIEKEFDVKPISIVIGHGLTPAFENMFSSQEEFTEAKEWRAAYTSSPYRGLEVLVNIYQNWDPETAELPMLDIFSSMKIHQMSDAKYQYLYEKANSNPRIDYHGAGTQSDLAVALRKSTFFIYPRPQPEAFPMSILEAAAAGAVIISVNYGSMTSTIFKSITTPNLVGLVGMFALTPKASNESLKDFTGRYKEFYLKNLLRYIERREVRLERMFAQSKAINDTCLWKHKAADWNTVIDILDNPEWWKDLMSLLQAPVVPENNNE